jgi:hypothetical protein
MLKEASGVAPAVDSLSGDGKVTFVDVQIAINFGLGLGCTLGGA